ncbi:MULTISPECIES: BA14K family protein [unclassified Rhizobium]|uniref:BA14K family protein n=1 Tax=unclassified Rhizobium TaxID=2613769 RepID=UPI001FCD843D|nr:MULTISPECIES: BA14K family protein [unclassified Rhizobium]
MEQIPERFRFQVRWMIGSTMPRKLKPFASLVLAGLMLGSTVTPASAFHIMEGNAPASGADGVVAFAGAPAHSVQADTSILSPEDILHIRWCATRYRTYHATDNSYASPSGQRVACRSPY